MGGSLRPLVHLAAVAGLVALGLALGRWLREPAAGDSVLGLLLLCAVVAVALRRLYRRGGIAWRPEPPMTLPGPPPALPAPPPAPLWEHDDDRVDLNTASADELRQLPGIGPVAAARILAERDRAPFDSVSDLTRVPGMGAAKIRHLADLVRTNR